VSISLQKGGQINLSKEAPSLQKAGIGLGWDINETQTGTAFDLDASVFMLGPNGKIPNEQFFIFYNNLKSPDGSVEHFGDSRTGEGGGDDEVIELDLTGISPIVEELIFVVTIHDYQTRRQNFGQVNNAFIRIYDTMTDKQVMKYVLTEQFSQETAVEFGRIFKQNKEWRFQAVGQGYYAGLQEFVDKYAS
jgi:tellurium resistance protein TerD